MTNREMTSYCGIWCGDCIPSKDKLFNLVKELNNLLTEINFEKYAKYKANRVPQFKKYNDFKEVLGSIEKIHCYNYCYNGPCSEAGCAQSCRIRLCVLEHQYEGCWECQKNEKCTMILDMEQLHPNIRTNLKLIKENGIDEWLKIRGSHYIWDNNYK